MGKLKLFLRKGFRNRDKIKSSFIFILVMILILSTTLFVFAEDPDPNVGERTFSGILRGLAWGVEELLEEFGLTMDSIIFNDNTGLEEGKVNQLAFSFKKGTLFGDIANMLYEIYKNIALVFMACVLPVLGLKVWLSPKQKNTIAWREALQSFVLAMVFIFIMPHILSFINEQILNIARSLRLNGNGLSFIEELKESARDSKTLIDAVLYFGGVGLIAYYGVMYAYRNMILIFLYMFFPIFAMTLNSERLKNGYESWVKEVGSALVLPLIDASLLLAVATIVAAGVKGFIALIMAGAMIPVRGKLRQLMGLSSGGMSEMAGFMALSGAAGLAKNMGKGIGRRSSQISEGIGEIKEAKKFGGESTETTTETEDKSNVNGYGGVNQSGNNFSQSPIFASADGDREQTFALAESTSGGMALEPINTLPSSNVGGAGSGFNFDMNSDASSSSTQTASTSSSQQQKPLEISQVKAPAGKDQYNYNLARQGRKKVFKGLGGMAGGMVGGVAAASFMSLQGAGAMSHAASMGGALGGAVGAGAGDLTGRGVNGIGRMKDEDKELYEKKLEENLKNPPIHYFMGENGGSESEATGYYNGDISTDTGVAPRGTTDMVEYDVEFATSGGTGQAQQNDVFVDPYLNQINKNVPQETQKQFKVNAKAMTTAQTGIDPAAVAKEHNSKVQAYYAGEKEKLQQQGVNITPEIEIEIQKNARTHANQQVQLADKVSRYNDAYTANYSAQVVDYAYQNLDKNGFDPNELSKYSQSIQQEIKRIVEQDLQMDSDQYSFTADDLF